MGEKGFMRRLMTETWPARAVQDVGDALRGLMSGQYYPGLRRSDVTDIPAPSGPTNDSTAIGRLLGTTPVSWEPNDKYIQDSSTIAGAVVGSPIRAPSGSLGSGLTLDYFGIPVRIVENPSPKQLAGFLSRTKYKAARRITDPETGAVYVWDAADPALHAMVAEKLGVKAGKQHWDTIGID